MAGFSQVGFKPGPGGSQVAFNVTAATQIVGASGANVQGYVYRVFVNTAPTAAGGVYDMQSGGTAGAGNLICAIPTTAGVIEIVAPFYAGLYVNPGTGGVVSVSYTP